MYAVIEIKGAQVLVEKNEKITVNKLGQKGTAKTLKIDKVLFGKKGNSFFIGEPYVEKAHVECEILGDKRLKKVIAFKYRDRKSSQSKIGHRQDVTELLVKDIVLPEETKPAKETAKPEAGTAKKQEKPKKAEKKK